MSIREADSPAISEGEGEEQADTSCLWVVVRLDIAYLTQHSFTVTITPEQILGARELGRALLERDVISGWRWRADTQELRIDMPEPIESSSASDVAP